MLHYEVINWLHCLNFVMSTWLIQYANAKLSSLEKKRKFSFARHILYMIKLGV